MPPKRKPNKKCPKTEYLVGPIAFDILDREDGARVVLLGDRHDYEFKCPREAKCRMTIVQYLDNFFQNYYHPEPLDFFLEVDFDVPREFDQKYIRKNRRWMVDEGQIEEDFLESLWIYFHNCLQKLKTKCEYHRKKQIRFHYSDVRSGVIHSKTRSEHAVLIKELQHLRTKTSGYEMKHLTLLKHLITRFLAAGEKDVDYFFHISKIDKQLGVIAKKNPNITQELAMVMFRHMEEEKKSAETLLARVVGVEKILSNLAFITHARKKHAELEKNLKKILGDLDEKESAKRKSDLDEIKSYLDEQENSSYLDETIYNLTEFVLAFLLTPLFDIYTLARMIRHDMKQVIIYAGNNHTQRIKHFLIASMGYEPVISRQSKDQCIDLRGIFQPWF